MARVLIVDDNALVRTVLRRFLKEKGAETFEAVDGIDAVNRGESLKPDVIILDLSMPRMNGLDAARALRKKFKNAFIILFTMYGNAVSRADMLSAGVNALVSKANVSELMERVEAMLPA